MRAAERPNRASWIAGAAAICVVAGALALYASRGGAPPADLPVAQGAPLRPPPAADPHEAARDAAEVWFSRTFFDAAGKALDLTGAEVRARLEEAERLGHAGVPGLDWDAKVRRLYSFVLKREPDDPDANRALGRAPLSDYPDFFDVFRRLRDMPGLPEELAALRDRFEDRVRYRPQRRAPALTPEEFAVVSGLLDRFRELERRLEDPTERAVYDALQRIALDPLLGEHETVRLVRPPYILFYGSAELKPKDSSERERLRVERVRAKLTEKLEQHRALIENYLAFFRERWMKPLGLPEFAPDQLFFVWVFGEREGFARYRAQLGLVSPPLLGGYFNPRDRWVFLFDNPEDTWLVDAALAHELTHQLHHHFSADPEGRFKNHFARLEAVWFSEGWAEYAGWTRKRDGGFAFAQDSRERMNLFHEFRKGKLPLYPLRKMIERTSYADWVEKVMEDWLLEQKFELREDADPKTLASIYLQMLYSQSWLFLKFLYEHEDGKYRQKILDFTRASLKGYMGYKGAEGYARAPEVFREIFGLNDDAKWAAFQAEFDRFLEKKLYEIPPLD